MPRTTAYALFLLSLITACESLTETSQRQSLGAQLSGAAVKPAAIETTGEGTLSGVLRTLNGEATMDFSLTFSGLAGAATEVHLHGPSNSANTAGVLVDLNALPAGSSGTVQLGGTSGSASGTLDLRVAITSTVPGDSLHMLLDAGLVYVDVHTFAHPAGEIRGQITKRQ
jgi:hypothetical protein